MPKECIIEFYFKVDTLKKLLKKNPDAKGIIVSQEIVPIKHEGAIVNIVHIKARTDVQAKPKAKAKVTKGAKLLGAGPGDDGSINGCPFPPGCTE